MPAKIINGKLIAEQVNQQTFAVVELLRKQNIVPKLVVILVGDNPASKLYVRKKQEAAQKTGIRFKLYELPTTISAQTLKNKILSIQKDKKLSGLIVQLPLPENLYTPEILNTISPSLDVDCLTDCNMGKLLMGTNKIIPPTPGAVMNILNALKIRLTGKNIVILGAGTLVGKPLAIILLNAGATVIVCNSKSKKIREKCLTADIIVSGVGKQNIVKGNMVKKGAIVIGAGVSFHDGKMFGDINVVQVSKKASYLTPTIGGVGPITVAQLLYNTAVLCQIKK